MKESLDIPDIRNKLSTITHLIALVQMGDLNSAQKHLIICKEAVNYLADRKVYEDRQEHI